MKKLLLFILLVCATVQAYSQEYPKVVLSGDYPDPSSCAMVRIIT